jgi:hypothetical protein
MVLKPPPYSKWLEYEIRRELKHILNKVSMSMGGVQGGERHCT